MKVSLAWLQKYFADRLPAPEALEDAFTFHAFEVEEREGDCIDLKVLPDRAGYALCHRGIAKELSAILDVPMKMDPLRGLIPTWPSSHLISVEVEDPQKCRRYVGAVVRGVKVGPSPDWLREALGAVGQRSINNIVDATNYVMQNIGQPLHAFDASKLGNKDGAYKIAVRSARDGERMTTLTGDELALFPEALVIADGVSGSVLGIAGVKGGIIAEVTNETTDLVVEAANFNGSVVRRGAQRLKIVTDSSLRFQNEPSAEIAAYGMRDVLDLITNIAGGEVEGVVDVYPIPVAAVSVVASLEKINGILGTVFSHSQVAGVFARLGFGVKIIGDTFTITPPFERTDIRIPEDLVEEVGRIIGYDAVEPLLLPEMSENPDQAHFRGAQRIKDFFVAQGFTEISTQSFAKNGDIALANPLDKTKPALRTSLAKNMEAAYTQAIQYAPLVLAPGQKPKLFEIGNVFTKDDERLVLAYVGEVAGADELNGILAQNTVGAGDVIEIPLHSADLVSLGKDYIPLRCELGAYHPFSSYPFIARDIAVWVPEGTAQSAVTNIIVAEGGDLIAQGPTLFDECKKDGKISYAFRFVFQAMDRTLTDPEANAVMERIYAKLGALGFTVR